MPADPPTPSANQEPLLINYRDSWQARPAATTKIRNLFLAADYVQTFTDLATMESACEAGRRAFNGIVAQHEAAGGGHTDPLPVDPLPEPAVFEPVRELDWIRWRAGLDHNAEADPAGWRADLADVERQLMTSQEGGQQSKALTSGGQLVQQLHHPHGAGDTVSPVEEMEDARPVADRPPGHQRPGVPEERPPEPRARAQPVVGGHGLLEVARRQVPLAGQRGHAAEV